MRAALLLAVTGLMSAGFVRADINVALSVLPLGEVRPEGWLRGHLERQATGLTGHAEELYDDIGKSDWLTGKNVGKEFAWERGPYYAKGLVSLALVLDDAALKVKARRWVDAILSSQRVNGDFGPKNRNWWANMIALWMLRDWCEATGDSRVVPFLERYFDFQTRELMRYPIARDSKWAVARAGDELSVVLWLYRKTQAPKWLAFARTISAQSADWTTFYYRGGDPAGPNANGCRSHIVNFMQGLKTPALQYLLDGDLKKRGAYDAAFDPKGWAMRQCGRPDRMLNGSEPLVDRSASQGTELCAIAERILSCQSVIAAIGDLTAADDLEIVAYNSLPATIAADGKGCRYYCLLNQPSCEDKFLCFACNAGAHGESSQTGAICPGPHAGFGCCRSNFHFAWPKFVQSMWMKKEGGLAAVAYGPCTVTTKIADREVALRMSTDYPYSGHVTIQVVKGGGKFPLFVRVPGWAGLADAGTFRKFDRVWQAGDRLQLDFPLALKTSFWEMDAVAISRGPLLYSLEIAAEERKVARYKVPHEDRWIENEQEFPRKEILPRSPWGYALLLDKHRLPIVVQDVGTGPKGVGTGPKDVGTGPKDVGTGPEVRLAVKAIKTDFGGWGYMRDVTTARAVDPPYSPVPDEHQAVETVWLKPMGNTQIRITLFPWISYPLR